MACGSLLVPLGPDISISHHVSTVEWLSDSADRLEGDCNVIQGMLCTVPWRAQDLEYFSGVLFWGILWGCWFQG